MGPGPVKRCPQLQVAVEVLFGLTFERHLRLAWGCRSFTVGVLGYWVEYDGANKPNLEFYVWYPAGDLILF
jgi:hypothetical protein